LVHLEGTVKVKIKFLEQFKGEEHLLTPAKATPGSAGFDLKAAEDVVIPPGCQAKVRSGFCIEVEEGFEVQVRPRSGLAIKNRVTLINAPGTVDSDYRGEMCAAMVNFGAEAFIVRKYDRVAQLVVAKLPDVAFEVVDALTETGRGAGGFGSTGISSKKRRGSVATRFQTPVKLSKKLSVWNS